MSEEHKRIALERIEDAFDNPTLYNISDIKYISMLNLTKLEIDEIMNIIKERLYQDHMINIEFYKAVSKVKL